MPKWTMRPKSLILYQQYSCQETHFLKLWAYDTLSFQKLLETPCFLGAHFSPQVLPQHLSPWNVEGSSCILL